MPLETSPASPPPLDYTDPGVLAQQCDSACEGLKQQAMASQHGTALSGHPYPAHFFGHCAALFGIMAERLRVEADKKPKPAPDNAATPDGGQTPPTAAPEPGRPARRN